MVILFDGVCNLCNAFVQFILERDKNKTFQFASLQSNYGKELSAHYNLSIIKPETIVLYEGVKILTQSDAVIKIVSSLNGIRKNTIVLKLVPRFIRNWFYRLVAKNRYDIFGKKDHCMIPTEDIKDRFLDNVRFIPN